MFLAHERKLIQLAEKMQLPLGYASSMDIAADAGLLRGASAVISGGHDEYWSPPERANVTAARNAGVNVAFLGANDDKLPNSTEVISNASCTTNSLGAVMSILDSTFGVEKNAPPGAVISFST